ncbi:MAG: hypothetical protein JSW02_07795 [candidate division WOR-3 bacterium]|nr:MAG: hypothetical protein JSW02_07795 [candidate division WOR-3 bacterium]
MKRKKLLVSIVLCLVLTTFSGGSVLNNLLSCLKQTVNGHPHIITRPNGGFFAIWYEVERIYPIPDMFVYEYRAFYQVLDEKGKTLIPKTELEFWKDDHYGVPAFDENSILFIDRNEVLIVARKMVHAFSNPPGYRLEKVLLDLTDDTVVRDSIKISFQRCSIVRDNAGNVYAAEVGYAWLHYAEIIQVKPHFGSVMKVIARYPREKFMKHYLDSEDNVITMTSQNDFLVAGRVHSINGEPVHNEPKGWSGLPNRVACFLVDTAGKEKIDSYEIDLAQAAFRRIPGVHMGIAGSGSSHEGFDFTGLPNGDIVLSVMGLTEDNAFCMYQVLFDSCGRLKKPEALEEVVPKQIPDDFSLPIMKIKRIITYHEYDPKTRKMPIDHGYVLFGFDKDGNYYEERMRWKEGDR